MTVQYRPVMLDGDPEEPGRVLDRKCMVGFRTCYKGCIVSGSKGCGEAGTIGAPPAIMNAVLDALAPLGITDLDMPATPERVFRAIAQHRPA